MEWNKKLKVGVIGAGKVGSVAAYTLMMNGGKDVVLLDAVNKLAEGVAEDIGHASMISGTTRQIVGTTNYNKLKSSRIIIITAGSSRTPDMTRKDLYKCNKGVIENVVKSCLKVCPNAFYVIVTNPVEDMLKVAIEAGLDCKKTIGLGSNLDSARFKYYINSKLRINSDRIKTYVVGPHNENMRFLIDISTVDDEPLRSKLSGNMISLFVRKTVNSGKRIIYLMGGRGGACFGPGMAINEVVEALCSKEPVVIPCAIYEYGEVQGRFVNLFKYSMKLIN